MYGIGQLDQFPAPTREATYPVGIWAVVKKKSN